MGAATADVQVVPRTCICYFHGPSSSGDIVVALKRAFWDLEDVLASVGTAKSSGGFVCTGLPCCQKFKRSENNSMGFACFANANVAVSGKKFFRRGHTMAAKLLWLDKNDSDYMKHMLVHYFSVTPLCKIRPARRKTRVVTLTSDNCVSG